MRYTLTLLLTLAACFAAQALALRAIGGRTTKSESNFFSSIGRIQAGAQGRPGMIVLGSSITGRLPDRAQGYEGVANMGCDGGSGIDTLRAMDKGILPSAPILVIEANTLDLALEPGTTEIGTAMTRQWFRVGKNLPLLSAYARPSAFFYTILLARRIGGAQHARDGDNLGVRSVPHAIDSAPAGKLTARQEELIGEIRGILARLKAKGCKSMIVWLPPARAAGAPPPDWVMELVHRSGSVWWDPGQEADPALIRLTDGVHMDSLSAARTMNSLQLVRSYAK
ncbi:MAG: hypothetical protein WCS43_13660 [Verrucomicrobiota bacterium]